MVWFWFIVVLVVIYLSRLTIKRYESELHVVRKERDKLRYTISQLRNERDIWQQAWKIAKSKSVVKVKVKPLTENERKNLYDYFQEAVIDPFVGDTSDPRRYL
jgi:hypothetical protein